MGEDFIFLLEYIFNVDVVCLSTKNNYNYIKIQDSLSQKFYSFESEYFTYIQLKDNLIKILTKYGIKNNSVDPYIWKIIGHTFIRTIRTGFRVRPKISISKQIEKLETISACDILIMKNEYKPQTLTTKVLNFLFINKFYYLYSFIGSVFD